MQSSLRRRRKTLAGAANDPAEFIAEQSQRFARTIDFFFVIDQCAAALEAYEILEHRRSYLAGRYSPFSPLHATYWRWLGYV